MRKGAGPAGGRAARCQPSKRRRRRCRLRPCAQLWAGWWWVLNATRLTLRRSGSAAPPAAQDNGLVTTATYKCDPATCQLPECQCATNKPPGGLSPDQIPQFVLVRLPCQDMAAGWLGTAACDCTSSIHHRQQDRAHRSPACTDRRSPGGCFPPLASPSSPRPPHPSPVRSSPTTTRWTACPTSWCRASWARRSSPTAAPSPSPGAQLHFWPDAVERGWLCVAHGGSTRQHAIGQLPLLMCACPRADQRSTSTPHHTSLFPGSPCSTTLVRPG